MIIADYNDNSRVLVNAKKTAVKNLECLFKAH